MKKLERVNLENKAILRILRDKKQVTIKDIRSVLWMPSVNLQLRLDKLEERGIIKRLGKRGNDLVFSIFDLIDSPAPVTDLDQPAKSVLVLHVNHEKQVIGPVDKIEKVLTLDFESDTKLLKIKADFFKVNDIDFYNTLFFEFPRLKVKCEYNLASEMKNNHKFSSLYLCKKDLKEYIEMRFGSFLAMSDDVFRTNEKFSIRIDFYSSNNFYERLKKQS